MTRATEATLPTPDPTLYLADVLRAEIKRVFWETNAVSGLSRVMAESLVKAGEAALAADDPSEIFEAITNLRRIK